MTPLDPYRQALCDVADILQRARFLEAGLHKATPGRRVAMALQAGMLRGQAEDIARSAAATTPAEHAMERLT